MEGLLNSAPKSAADDLSDRLRNKATERGWPPEVAQNLSVTTDPVTGALSPTWPDDANDAVMAYEAGTTTRSPLPIIHEFFESPEGAADVRAEVMKHVGKAAKDLKKRLFT